MDAEISEKMFASYLEAHSLAYTRHVPVNGKKNVDFLIDGPNGSVFCDVKEVRDSTVGTAGQIDAYSHIREDLKNLRKKFGKQKPTKPLVLVAMNFSKTFFTGHTVARAMYGDVGVLLKGKVRSLLHHLPRGNASMTKVAHTTLAGVLVFDGVNSKHVYFGNEFASNKLPPGYFPGMREIHPKRDAGERELAELSRIMFWDLGYLEGEP